MAEGGVVSQAKYPKTPHLPFSPGVNNEDIVLSTTQCSDLPILSEEAVISEKLDGGNCSIYQGKVYARTVSSEATHASFGPIKQLASQICYAVPRNIQLFGENLFGIHSIEYDQLKVFFYLFAALEGGATWLAWDHVTELANEIGVPTVPLLTRNQFETLEDVESAIKKGMSGTSHCGSCHPEGFVIRTAGHFRNDSFEKHVAKYVRAGHIQTDDSWRRTWKQAKISKR